MWSLPQPRVEPGLPVLASEFFATEPPGKPLHEVLREAKLLFSEKSSNSGYLVNGAESKQKATGIWQVSSLFVGGGHLDIYTQKLIKLSWTSKISIWNICMLHLN